MSVVNAPKAKTADSDLVAKFLENGGKVTRVEKKKRKKEVKSVAPMVGFFNEIKSYRSA